MNFRLAEDQRILQESLARLFAEHSTGARIRAAEPLGFDRALWDALTAMQLPLLRVPESLGGAEASLMHAVIAAEEAGASLASVPLVEAIVANRLLAQLSGADAAGSAMSAPEGGLVTLALHDTKRRPRQLVPAGAIADAVVCIEGERVVLHRGLRGEARPSHGSVPARLLDLDASEVRIPLGGTWAVSTALAAVEEWKLLTASLVAAAGRRALQKAAEYTNEREAFGRRIGEYQGVSHPLADAITDIEGARLLIWRSVHAIARIKPNAAAMISKAFWWAASAASPAALKAMRVFGGYGVTLEYDAQLYFRRINAWASAAGSPDATLDEVARRLWGGEDAPLPAAGDVGIDFEWNGEASEAADRMRAFCVQRDSPALQRFMRESLDCFDLPLQRELAREGLLYPDSPREFGGSGLSGEAAAAVRDVCNEFYWNLLAPSVTDMVWKIVHRFGSDRARQEILPRIFAGEAYCTLAYTEPSGGSDIFAAKTTAVREGDDWLINGQKMFTSTAHLADYALMIARTGADKYRGVTMFIVPLRQPGFQVTEIKTIGDERTNVTFYSDVRVPDAYRLGEVDGGVKVMSMALTIEQAVGDLYVMSLNHLLRHALAWAVKPSDQHDGRAPIETQDVRRALAETSVRLSIVDALNRRCIWATASSALAKSDGPMAKLFGSESWVACSAKLMRVAAPESLFKGTDEPSAIEWLLRRSISGTIFAGTSEIQRSIIAETALGTPRSR